MHKDLIKFLGALQLFEKVNNNDDQENGSISNVKYNKDAIWQLYTDRVEIKEFIDHNIEFFNGECPYSTRALRGDFRDIIDNLEYSNPGTRHSILNSYEHIKDLLLEKYPPVELNACNKCGEPTSQEICKTCILLERIS